MVFPAAQILLDNISRSHSFRVDSASATAKGQGTRISIFKIVYPYLYPFQTLKTKGQVHETAYLICSKGGRDAIGTGKSR